MQVTFLQQQNNPKHSSHGLTIKPILSLRAGGVGEGGRAFHRIWKTEDRGRRQLGWTFPTSPLAVSPSPSHRVLVPLLLRIVRFPATGGEDVLVLLVPASQHHLTCMRLEGETKIRVAGFTSHPKRKEGLFPQRMSSPAEKTFSPHLILFHGGVVHETDVIVHVEAEKRPWRQTDEEESAGGESLCVQLLLDTMILTGFASGFGHDEVIKAVVLKNDHQGSEKQTKTIWELRKRRRRTNLALLQHLHEGWSSPP